MSRKIIFLIILLCATVKLAAQTYALDRNPIKSPAFESGERLEYLVSYKIGFLNVDVATVVFDVTDSKIEGRDVFHIKAVGEVRPNYTWFYNLYDVYNTYLDKEDLRPLYFSNELREDKYRFKSNYVYDWNAMNVKTTSRNLNWDADSVRVFPLSEVSYDAVSLFFNLRSVNLSTMKEGVYYPLDVVFANKVRKIQYVFLGREKKDVKNIGKINCLKFKCQLANASGNSFEDGNEFTIWISDDKNRIPIFVDSPIRVGSVKVRISSYENLKYLGTLKIE